MKTTETLTTQTATAKQSTLAAFTTKPLTREDLRMSNRPALEQQKAEIESRIGQIDHCHLDFITQADNVTRSGAVIDKTKGNFILEQAVIAGAVLEGRYDDRWYGDYLDYEDVCLMPEDAGAIPGVQDHEWQWLYCTADGGERFRVISFLNPQDAAVRTFLQNK